MRAVEEDKTEQDRTEQERGKRRRLRLGMRVSSVLRCLPRAPSLTHLLRRSNAPIRLRIEVRAMVEAI